MDPNISTISAGGCLDRDRLLDFDLGRLPELGIDAVAVHLSSCDRCEEALIDLRREADDDSFLSLLRHCLERPIPPIDPACDAIEARARAIFPDLIDPERTAEYSDPGRPAEVVWLKTVGQYDLLGQIGGGGMGVVYRARHRRLKRIRALKMILAGHHADDRTRARFEREAQAIARLEHPNVVRVYDSGESEGHPFFVMELVNGEDLQAKLAVGLPGFREAAALVRTLAEAVQYAHQQGVLHRDLKPANVLIDEDGTPKITDFGLAKLVDPDSDKLSSATDLTETGSVMGTASYMAPEQAEGKSGEVGRGADIYSLGAILYALLTGRPPFIAETKYKTLELVRTAPPIPPAKVRPGGVPFGLESICLKCLEKSPARRYASARELADDLGRWLNDEAPEAIPGWTTRIRRVVRRNRAAVLIGAATIAFALVLAAFGLSSYLNDPRRALERMEGDLACGRAVSPIDTTGKPKYMRMVAGQADAHADLAADQTFRIHAETLALVELLPDPRCERYRFSAQVRHDASELMGEIGLYVGRTTFPRGPQSIHCFTELTFNDVISRSFVAREILGRKKPLDMRNTVRLSSKLFSDPNVNPVVGRELSHATGPRFLPEASRWNDLEVVVTPDKVTALWNGQPFSKDVSQIQREGMDELRRGPLPDVGAGRPELRPFVNARGGLGFSISKGTASFRAVKVTPF